MRTRSPVAALCAAALLLFGCHHPPPPAPVADRLLRLTAGDWEAGVLPDGGGRLVLLRHGTDANLLLADPTLWAATATLPQPDPLVNVPQADPQGRVLWVAPQAAWWTQQTRNDDRRSRAAVWPPDPWLEYGRCRVLRQTATELALEGPVSEVTGLQLYQTFTLTAAGHLTLATRAVNRRPTPVRWALWSNTRLPATSTAIVPLDGGRMALRFDTKDPLHDHPPRWQADGGWLRLAGNVARPLAGERALGKLQAWPAAPWVAVCRESYLLQLRVTSPTTVTPAPDHAPVELYTQRDHAGGGVLEVEFHGDYRTVAPGEELTLREEWQAWPYAGATTQTAVGAFLQTQGALTAPATGGQHE